MSISRNALRRNTCALRPPPAPRLFPRRCLQTQLSNSQSPSRTTSSRASSRLSRSTSSLQPLSHLPLRHRSFSSDTLSPTPLTLSETRILPYETSDLYAIIADIDAYSSFLPFCLSSTITSRSPPDASHNQTRWPLTADLKVGYAGYEETFTSKIHCSPSTNILEALCGSAESSRFSQSAHDSQDSQDHFRKENALFEYLRTTWNFKSFPFKPPPAGSKEPQAEDTPAGYKPRTEVSLSIEVKFKNLMYAALSQAAAPKVAGAMIGAFEKRAKEVLGEGHGGGEGSVDKKPMLESYGRR